MFTPHRYIEVNREERHYCSLFVHSLLSSGIARTYFAELVSSKCNEIKLDSKRMEIFIEVAALRDYWNKLYDDNTHANRKGVLSEILGLFEYDASIICDHQFFWTKEIGGKLWNPGHWSVAAIEQSGLSDVHKLINIKWAFNAKPDIMIISNSNAILVEAKLESSESKYGKSGEDQEKIQKQIGYLLKKLVPAFQDITFHNALLARNYAKEGKWSLSVTWQELIDIISKTDIDSFTKENFEQLRLRYYPDQL